MRYEKTEHWREKRSVLGKTGHIDIMVTTVEKTANPEPTEMTESEIPDDFLYVAKNPPSSGNIAKSV